MINIPLYDAGEFMKRRIQIINSEAVLRIRELRQRARKYLPPVGRDMNDAYFDCLCNAQQIDLNMNFLLDMFGVDPLPSVSVPTNPEPPKGAA